jgi:hypothetical protein
LTSALCIWIAAENEGSGPAALAILPIGGRVQLALNGSGFHGNGRLGMRGGGGLAIAARHRNLVRLHALQTGCAHVVADATEAALSSISSAGSSPSISSILGCS